MNQIIDDSAFESAQAQTAARQFFGKVYALMFGALLVTGLIAFQYGTPDFVKTYFITATAKGVQLSGLFWLVALAPIGVGLAIQGLFQRISFPVLLLLFTIYSVLMGFSLTTIFITYTLPSITGVFFATAGTFGVMAIMGYITKVDLTRFGSILYMVFFGMIIASLVNWFIGSDGLGYIVSILGVFVFTGLTAYHMQQLKVYAITSQDSEETKSKWALIGAFTLYLLFINLFLTLLRLFGERE